MPSAAACRGRPLLALPLLALALLALIPTAAADGPDCPTGTITLHLIAGNIQDPYAVCFPTFTVTVTESNNRCLLRVSPDAIANTLKWGNETDSNGAEDCPKSTATLQAFVADNTLDAVNAALLRAMRNASFSTSFLDGIEVQSNARIRAIMNTPGAGADLTYAVTSGTLSISGVDIQPGSNSDNACGTVNECKSNSAVNSPARYSVSIGNNQNIRALCPAGSSCNGSSRTACPAGQAATFVGSSACTSCAAGGYTDVAGSSHCTPCPGYSQAHFTGSTGCLACFFGEPRLVAGTLNGNNNPLFPNNMPSEQPSAGYRIYSVTSDIKTCSLGNSNPFRTCAASTANRMLAVETDATCVVRVYVLGDSACSKMDSVAVVQGAYRNLTHIESRGEDDSENDSVALALQAAVVGATNPSLRLTKGNDNCNTALARRGEGATGRNQCPEGTDIEDNKQGGNINPKACTPCDPGMQCGTVSNNRVADLCIPGTFSDVWGATQCQACTGLTAAITSGAVRCQECAAGTTPTNDKRNCQLCPAGQFSNVTGEACRNCPRGTFREANSGDGTECIPCSPGSFAANEGSGSCTDCALGRFATDEGSTSCSNCPRGSFANTTGSHECDTCEPGWFAANSGSATCTACPAGQITVASANAGATECRNCPRGTFRPANATDNKCQTCPAGWFTNNTAIGATACLPCPAGTFSQFPNSVSCTPCTGANYTDTQAARACKICPAGQVAVGPSGFAQGFPNGNSAASGSTRCLPCPRRTFRPSILSINTCTVCPAGRETRRNEGASICQACIPGFTLLNANDVNCTVCDVGRFSDAPGRSGACPQCATGTFVADTGNQRCDVCAPGSYQDTTGQTACIECPVGTYSEMSGANSTSTCKPAPPGNFAEGTGNDGFTPCLAGTFQDKSGQGACKDCPPGNACPTGATNPRVCAAGFFAEPKSPFCRECPKGQFQNLGGQRACKPCPAGRYCPNSKMTAGTLCPAGTFNRNVGQTLATACLKCPVNSFSATPGAQKCQPCSDLGSGRWTGRLTGQTTCWPTSQALPTNPQPAGGKNLGRRRS